MSAALRMVSAGLINCSSTVKGKKKEFHYKISITFLKNINIVSKKYQKSSIKKLKNVLKNIKKTFLNINIYLGDLSEQSEKQNVL